MTSRAELERLVADRAGHRCEYCRMHEALQGARFHLEHVLPIAVGGATHLDNLAWACPSCNLHKSRRLEATDPDTGRAALLFHPRSHVWQEHFSWDDYHIIGLTATGRATVAAFGFNEPRKILIRQAEQTFRLFPPES